MLVKVETETNTTEYINWLTILRGWVVLLVILFHSPIGEYSDFFSHFNKVFHFRMPLFFFISGFLLYHTKLRKNASFKSVVKDRISRIFYPYFFITLILFVLKGLLNGYVKQQVDFSVLGFLKTFLFPINTPIVTFWFLNAILIFMLSYKLIKYSLTKTYLMVIYYILSWSISYLVPKDIGFLDLSTLCAYYIYFYTGVVFAKYKIQEYISFKVFLIMLVLFVVYTIYSSIISYYIISITGIVISVYISQKITKFLPKLFSTYRDYYYQIYLLGTIFQIIIVELFLRFKLNEDVFIYPLISILAGLYMPVVISKIIKSLNWKPLKMLIGLK